MYHNKLYHIQYMLLIVINNEIHKHLLHNDMDIPYYYMIYFDSFIPEVLSDRFA